MPRLADINLDVVRRLADEGFTARGIAREIGVTKPTIRNRILPADPKLFEQISANGLRKWGGPRKHDPELLLYDYKVGAWNLRELARRHGITDTAVRYSLRRNGVNV